MRRTRLTTSCEVSSEGLSMMRTAFMEFSNREIEYLAIYAKIENKNCSITNVPVFAIS
jgi:hypothetical protein